MIISHKYRYIFVKTAKTAGTSIEVFLHRARGPLDVFTPFAMPESDHEPINWQGLFNPIPELLMLLRLGRSWWRQARATLTDLVRRNKFTMHLPAWRIRCRVGGTIWNHYYKFCVERDPYEKVVSGWYYYQGKLGYKVSLDHYLDYCQNRIDLHMPGVGVCPFNFYNYVDPSTGQVLVDRVLRYEHLDSELDEVLRHLGIPLRGPMDVRAKAQFRPDHRPATEILTEGQKQRVAELFRMEFQLHGYPANGAGSTPRDSRSRLSPLRRSGPSIPDSPAPKSHRAELR